MEDKLNGELLSYYGLTLVEYVGILDMPSRIGDTFYDWGDTQMPLVHEDDIYWSARTFSMKLIFDTRKTIRSIESVIQELSELEECNLETSYGTFLIKIKEIINVTSYGIITKLTIILNERDPQFNATLSSAIGGGSYLIDGYGLKTDFGISVEDVIGINSVPTAKSTEKTIYQSSKGFTDYRKFKVIEIFCFKIFSNKAVLSETMEKFKKILSQDGFRTVSLSSETYSCFLTEGFKIIFVGKNMIKFKLRLNINPD